MIRHLFVLTALMTASSAIAETSADKVKSACLSNAMMEHAKAVVALRASPIVYPTLETVMASRRLDEGYCLQIAHCLSAGGKFPDVVLAVEFEKCLDEEAEEHLQSRKEVAPR